MLASISMPLGLVARLPNWATPCITPMRTSSTDAAVKVRRPGLLDGFIAGNGQRFSRLEQGLEAAQDRGPAADDVQVDLAGGREVVVREGQAGHPVCLLEIARDA